MAKHTISQKVHLNQTRAQVMATNKAGGPTSSVGRQAGGPTSSVGREGRWADMAGGPTRQVGRQGKWADKAGRPVEEMCLLKLPIYCCAHKQN